MLNFPSCKQSKPSGQYDPIVIGSGLVGMTTAALLSQNGKNVLVLDKHYTISRFTPCIQKEGRRNLELIASAKAMF